METGVQIAGGTTKEGQGGVAVSVTLVLSAEQAQELASLLTRGQVQMAIAVAQRQAGAAVAGACPIPARLPPPELEQVPDASTLNNEQRAELLRQLVAADPDPASSELPPSFGCGCED